jgi:hypothetical protein
MLEKQSYSEWVEAWSNPAVIRNTENQKVLACNSASVDVFGTQVDWLRIGSLEWADWWENPTDRSEFELIIQGGVSRKFSIRSGTLGDARFVVFEDKLEWKELRESLELNKTRYQALAAGTMEGLVFFEEQ